MPFLTQSVEAGGSRGECKRADSSRGVGRTPVWRSRLPLVLGSLSLRARGALEGRAGGRPEEGLALGPISAGSGLWPSAVTLSCSQPGILPSEACLAAASPHVPEPLPLHIALWG